MFFFLLALALLVSLLGLLIILLAVWDLCLRLPYVPTPTAVSQAMCAITPWTGKEKRIVDLGAGDGRLLENILEEHPHLRADGFEISPVVWMLAMLRSWWRGNSVHVHFQSLFNADLYDTDVVYIYLLPSLMNKLAAKLDQELKPGTPVVSHAFRFKNRTPEKVVTVQKKGKEVDVLLYRW